jgi:hypothetical protein
MARSKELKIGGCFFQRGERWHWRVRLPNEETASNRPLGLPGCKATTDKAEARQIAEELWKASLLASLGVTATALGATTKTEARAATAEVAEVAPVVTAVVIGCAGGRLCFFLREN